MSADSVEVVRGVAPEWPFVGIAESRYDWEHGEIIVEYWDSNTGAFREVLVSDLPADSWVLGCPGSLSVSPLGVLYSTHTDLGYLEVVVPWDDDAYPVFWSERFIDHYAPAGQLHTDGSDARQLDIDMQYGILRVDNSADVGYYVLEYILEGAGQELVPVGPREGEEAFASEPDDEEMTWGSISREIGSAGFYYGFEVQHSEPACIQAATYVVDGRNGELVQCSVYFGGRSLVFIGASSLRTLELPKPHSSAACDGFDLGKLDPSGEHEREPG
ncbi:hypothetical protein [Candidatus Poriferisodalis sp.]|uniref:hypothetical protein n=1 Tax=Candidatus Poriferisodalis sp. TaxID=3101277 RepID=UPI003B014E57